MRFLVDECTGPAVAAWLRDHKHEVFSVFEIARGMDDDDTVTDHFNVSPEDCGSEQWLSQEYSDLLNEKIDKCNQQADRGDIWGSELFCCEQGTP